MESFKLTLLFWVQGPGFGAVQERAEEKRLIYQYFASTCEVFVIPHSCSKLPKHGYRFADACVCRSPR